MTKATAAKKSQLDKFKEAARELETDDSEEAFDRVVRQVARPPEKKVDRKPPKRP